MPEELLNPTESNIPPSITCPSCGANCPPPIGGETMVVCPVCGTRFESKHTELAASNPPPETANQSQPVRFVVPAADKPQFVRRSTEELLLDRLVEEQPLPKQTPAATLVVIVLAIIALGVGISLVSRDKDKFAKPPEGAIDSTEIFHRRIVAQQAIDSIRKYLAINNNDATAHQALANAYYDSEDWSHAREEYAIYLAASPRDVNARVDYAYSIANVSPDVALALIQIDSALLFEPTHVKALFDGGVLSLGSGGADHKDNLKRARSYFERAKKAADQSSPEMAVQIDRILSRMDSMAKSVVVPSGEPAK